MKLATPRWWYVRDQRAAPVLRALLRPIGWIWAGATARRIARTAPIDAGVPVICVGNLTVGGTGKTPIVRELLRLLAEQRVDAAALSRGHGGRLAGPIAVDPARHTAEDVGDEPLMLARDNRVFVARDRPAGALAAHAAGARAVVMDDGHQNPTLKKTLSLVVVDGESRDGEWPFGDGSVFPAGPMREPLGTGLARADAVIILLPADLPAPDPDLLAMLASRPVLIARLEPLAPPPAGRQLGFAGVGKPWKVERALAAAGCDLVDFIPLPDHSRFSAETLRFLERRAAELGAGLVTTEKDWARLPADWRGRATPWPVRARFEDEATVAAMLEQALGRPRTAPR
ncbi:MAG: tetraacyldisaccharide 4'-kinase [Caulobacteraceae bacterium]|nr:tetraacyldisaccharide 4'-kinase [Caulobacteraceae bacterium]